MIRFCRSEGSNYPNPGELSLAHRGVLFLDELPEFGLRVLEVLRQPIEDNMVTISRAQVSLTFPANFQMLAAMNPCHAVILGIHPLPYQLRTGLDAAFLLHVVCNRVQRQ